MRKKIITIFLSCFLFVSSSIRSYAFAPALALIAPEMASVLVTLATASGVIMSTKDDIYDLNRIFYENHSSDWANVIDTFKKDVTIGTDKVVHVGQDFLDLCKSTFDKVFTPYNSLPNITSLDYNSSIPVLNFDPELSNVVFADIPAHMSTFNDDGNVHSVNSLISYKIVGRITYFTYLNQSFAHSNLHTNSRYFKFFIYKNELCLASCNDINTMLYTFGQVSVKLSFEDTYSLPYVPGSYDWGKVGDKVGSDGFLDVYVPADAGNLVGAVPKDIVVDGVVNPPWALPVDGTVTIPKVENPSIDLDTNSPFPSIDNPDPPDPDNPDNPQPPSQEIPIADIDISPIVSACSNLQSKFPFSIYWDFKNIIKSFDVTPVCPKFIFPLMGSSFTIDLSIINPVIKIFRFFEWFAFICCLMYLTRKIKGGE